MNELSKQKNNKLNEKNDKLNEKDTNKSPNITFEVIGRFKVYTIIL